MAISLRFHLLLLYLLLISAATVNSDELDDDDDDAAPSFLPAIYRAKFCPSSNLYGVISPVCFHPTANITSLTVSVSDLSYNVQCMESPYTLASIPPPPPGMPIMLDDAILRLQNIGYRVVAIALRFKRAELSELKAMTVFALEDASIFSDATAAYLSNFWYHVVPRKRLREADLVALPPRTWLPTMDFGRHLVVTAAFPGEPLGSVKINNVELVTVDLLKNSRIVVHGISSPFRRRQQYGEGHETDGGVQLARSNGLNEVASISNARFHPINDGYSISP